MNPEPKTMAAILSAINAYIQQEQANSTMPPEVSPGAREDSTAKQDSTKL